MTAKTGISDQVVRILTPGALRPARIRVGAIPAPMRTAVYGSSEWWRVVLFILPALLHLGWPVVGIVLARRVSAHLLAGLPMLIGAAGQP